ncbi:hypothetical protein KI387_033847, partial [Taxus chinensis]
VKDSKAKLAFTVPELVEKVRSTGLPLVLVTLKHQHEHHVITFADLLHCDSDKLPSVKIRQDDTAALLYSSGTTGVSKGVVITHRNIISMIVVFIRFILEESEINSWESVFLAVLPMFHVYGIATFTSGLIAAGATCVVMP